MLLPLNIFHKIFIRLCVIGKIYVSLQKTFEYKYYIHIIGQKLGNIKNISPTNAELTDKIIEHVTKK